MFNPEHHRRRRHHHHHHHQLFREHCCHIRKSLNALLLAVVDPRVKIQKYLDV